MRTCSEEKIVTFGGRKSVVLLWIGDEQSRENHGKGEGGKEGECVCSRPKGWPFKLGVKKY